MVRITPPGMENHKWLFRIAFAAILVAFASERYGKYKAERQAPPPQTAEGSAPPKEKEGIKTRLERMIEEYASTEEGSLLAGALLKRSVTQETKTEDISLGIAQHAKNRAYYYDVKTGQGEPLHCGDKAKLHWRILNRKNAEVVDTRRIGPPVEIAAGDNSIVPGVERSLIGMRRGGIRRVSVPSTLAYENTGFFNTFVIPTEPVTFEVSLEDVAPAVAAGTAEVAVLSVADVAPDSPSSEAACGMKLRAAFALAGKDGPSVVREFVLGKEGVVPLWMQRVVEGRRLGQSTTTEIAVDERTRGFLSELFPGEGAGEKATVSMTAEEAR
jgi:FKBP-type peptidyl-prolyl cis-trans isomerase